jgi:hypothetical protein
MAWSHSPAKCGAVSILQRKRLWKPSDLGHKFTNKIEKHGTVWSKKGIDLLDPQAIRIAMTLSLPWMASEAAADMLIWHTADSPLMQAFGSRLLTGTCRGTSRVWSICCVTVLGRRLRSIGFRLCRARATALSGFATSCPGTSARTGLARVAPISRPGPGPVVSSS